MVDVKTNEFYQKNEQLFQRQIPQHYEIFG
jgi:hypothetical protein